MGWTMEERAQEVMDRCKEMTGTDPVAMALPLMAGEKIRLHGPEHHFLVAAVLMTATCNATGRPLKGDLEQLWARTQKIPPGVCGYYGVCGDTLGAGAFLSHLLGNHYLAGESWRINGAFTAQCQANIARSNGPRCCKRTTFATLEAAAVFLSKEGIANLKVEQPVVCRFFAQNKEQCLKEQCPYYPKTKTGK
jgi:hypothetical protein